MKIVKQSNPDTGQRPRGSRRLVAVATLPTLLTLGNLLCGMAAIYCAMLAVQSESGEVSRLGERSDLFQRMLPTYLAIGAYLLFIAMVCDALDGRIARLTRRTSDFGGQLDSLADTVSAGVAPAVLMLALVMIYLRHHPEAWLNSKLFWRAVWMAAAVYVSCGAMRLARFNVENTHDEAAHRYFKGLPSPGAAAAMAGLIVLHEEVVRIEMPGASQWLITVMPIAAFVLGLFMVSRMPYVHLMNMYLRGRRPISHMVGIVIVLALSWIYPQQMLAAVACGYALSGAMLALYRRMTGRPLSHRDMAPHDADEEQGDQTDSRTG